MGNQLFNEVAQLTGLPLQLIEKELKIVLAKRGYDSNSVTLKELRQAMAIYLREAVNKIIGTG